MAVFVRAFIVKAGEAGEADEVGRADRQASGQQVAYKPKRLTRSPTKARAEFKASAADDLRGNSLDL